MKTDVLACGFRHQPVDKPHAPETEHNRDAILAALRRRFSRCTSVLEIGSGTGQHAIHFAEAMPHLVWQTSDLRQNLAGIQLWLDEAGLTNTPDPLALDVSDRINVPQRYDAVFSANTLHMMRWDEIEQLFSNLPRLLAPHGLLAIYGPFKYRGCFRSFDHACLDALLRLDVSYRGIRDFEVVNALASTVGLKFLADLAMPRGCRCLFWRLEPANRPYRIK